MEPDHPVLIEGSRLAARDLVPVEDGHLMPAPNRGSRDGKTDDACTDDNDMRHVVSFYLSAGRNRPIGITRMPG
jgi:hypothetical protein